MSATACTAARIRLKAHMPNSSAEKSPKSGQRATPRSFVVLPAIASCALFALGGCSATDSGPGQDTVVDGPLSTTLDAGGNSVLPPKRTAESDEEWRATFGSLLICSPDPVTLLDAEPHEVQAGEGTYAFTLRTVPAMSERRGGAPISWAPVGTMRGTPRQLASRGDLRSTSLADLDGAQISQPCGSGPGDAFTEVLTTIETGRSGAWVDGVDVTYETDGRKFTLPVDWSFVACGEAIEDPDVC